MVSARFTEYLRKRRRVLRLLKSDKWKDQSTNAIAMMAGVSWLFCDKIRTEHEADSRPAKRLGRDGRSYTTTYSR